MNWVYAIAVGLRLALGNPDGMQPRVLLGDSSHCDAVMIHGGHLRLETVCTKNQSGLSEVAWDGRTATISETDQRASADWIRAHSLLSRLAIHHDDLYWDGKKVNLGKVSVKRIDEAIPWQGGVLISGRTVPRRGFFESWPFKGDFIEVRDIDPFCAIYFDLTTLSGEDLWLGKVIRPFFVFPIPH